jgi:competence protein ComEA
MNRKIVVVLIFSVFIVIGGIIYAKGHAADSGKDDAASFVSSGSGEAIADNLDATQMENAENGGSQADGSKSSGESASATEEQALKDITVHILGAVKMPGVYTLAGGSRIIDAVDAAGGFTEDADEGFLNLAYVLTDALRVAVPTKKETKELEEAKDEVCEGQNAEAGTVSNTDGKEIKAGYVAGVSSGISAADASGTVDTNVNQSSGNDTENSSSSGKVNINTADKDALMTLTGIGSSKADAIIAYRNENGNFKDISEIMNVSGIKEGSYNKIKDSITVN